MISGKIFFLVFLFSEINGYQPSDDYLWYEVYYYFLPVVLMETYWFCFSEMPPNQGCFSFKWVALVPINLDMSGHHLFMILRVSISCKHADAVMRKKFQNLRKILTFERKTGKTGIIFMFFAQSDKAFSSLTCCYCFFIAHLCTPF